MRPQPKQVSIDGFAGHEWPVDFEGENLTYVRQPDRSYAVLDRKPLATNVLIAVRALNDIIAISVTNPEETDNALRKYKLSSVKINQSMSHEPGKLASLEVRHDHILGMRAKKGATFGIGGIFSEEKVEEIVSYDRNMKATRIGERNPVDLRGHFLAQCGIRRQIAF